MKKAFSFIQFLIYPILLMAQSPITAFDTSGAKETATYKEVANFYTQLAKHYQSVSVKNFGETDAGYPLQLVLISNDGQFDPRIWRQQQKVIILINNGIHPGEPDGIDASMLFARDIVSGKIKLPVNVAIAIIPLYNIGGALNRNSYSRVNQNGPVSYGFRGNAQNLDLNRDFTKADSKNAMAFAKIFHYLEPHIFIDNHVSDGADYQHTMTLLSTQHNKLGGTIGHFLHETFDPAVYKKMSERHWPMVPYVNFEDANPEKGWAAFMDPPRYGSGYAALFQTIAYVPETHMLKPFNERVKATYTLMETIVDLAGKYSKEIINAKQESVSEVGKKNTFPLTWKIDSTKSDRINFMGYAAAYKTSDVTGMKRLYYDHSKPFEKEVTYYNYFEPEKWVTAPKAYIIPKGWHNVIERLKMNNVQMQALPHDTLINVEVHSIADYKSLPRPYEGHHKNFETSVTTATRLIQFLNGDYIIFLNQPAKRYIIEMLEPEGDDSFFAWNFFDAILQQKEGYSDYRWEDLAATYLQDHPEVRKQLDEKKKADKQFAESSRAQLYFVYTHSPYYEPAHNRYPVYRLVQ